MAFITIKRKTKLEKRYSRKMGSVSVKVTYIKKHLLGVPLKTLHKYRETYYGTIKDCEECTLTA
ncbi:MULTISPECIES: hypothetical protein [Joostella]|uniref:hypothetical protein n=1 Tax=Joostella TaxID=453850 RepID=UPI001F27B42F|nr:hypothetical protein [Joostella atrarenae]